MFALNDVYIHPREILHKTDWFFCSPLPFPTHLSPSPSTPHFSIFILVGCISVSSCLWHITFTFFEVSRFLYMEYLNSYYFFFSFLSPLSPSFLDPFSFAINLFPCFLFSVLSYTVHWNFLIQMREVLYSI